MRNIRTAGARASYWIKQAAIALVRYYIAARVQPPLMINNLSVRKLLPYLLGLTVAVAVVIKVGQALEDSDILPTQWHFALLLFFVGMGLGWGNEKFKTDDATSQRLFHALEAWGLDVDLKSKLNHLDRVLIDWAISPAAMARRRRDGLAGYAKTSTIQPRRPEM